MAKSNSGWIFEWCRGWATLKNSGFLREWQALAAGSPDIGIFQEPILVRGWLDTRGRDFGVEPYFLWARNEDGSNVVIPFCLWPGTFRNSWQRRLVPAGEPHFDYQDPLGVGPRGKPVDWALFWNALVAHLRGQSWFELAGLVRLSADRAPAESVPDSAVTSPYIDLREAENLDAYLKGLGTSHRGDLRRQGNRLAALGEVSCEVFRPDQTSGALAELGRMQDAYRREWEGQPAATLFCSSEMMRFYTRLVTDLLPGGWLHFSVLKAAHHSVSWHLGFLHRGAFHYYKPAYDPEYAAYSPGKLHCLKLIEMGFGEGWERFDFGAGNEGYKLLWTRRQVDLRQVWLRPGTPRAWFCATVRKVAGRPS